MTHHTHEWALFFVVVVVWSHFSWNWVSEVCGSWLYVFKPGWSWAESVWPVRHPLCDVWWVTSPTSHLAYILTVYSFLPATPTSSCRYPTADCIVYYRTCGATRDNSIVYSFVLANRQVDCAYKIRHLRYHSVLFRSCIYLSVYLTSGRDDSAADIPRFLPGAGVTRLLRSSRTRWDIFHHVGVFQHRFKSLYLITQV